MSGQHWNYVGRPITESSMAITDQPLSFNKQRRTGAKAIGEDREWKTQVQPSASIPGRTIGSPHICWSLAASWTRPFHEGKENQVLFTLCLFTRSLHPKRPPVHSAVYIWTLYSDNRYIGSRIIISMPCWLLVNR